FRLNGAEKALFVEDGANLLDVLRRGVGDLPPKYGCGQGTCGTCTVLVDGEPRLACLTLAETVEGAAITTTAGLAHGAELHPLQRAFMEGFAAQCGYCTPGMLMAAKALLDRNPRPSRGGAGAAISGHNGRATGDQPTLHATLAATGPGGARSQASR